MGVEQYENRKLETLSKGNQQKIQLAQTLICDPEIIILDEPFSGFDPVNAEIVRHEILRLKEEGSTIILSTHDMSSVEELCDNLALINNSHVVITGGVDEIRRQFGKNEVELVYTDEQGTHTSILPKETDGALTLESYLQKGVNIVSYRELIPRMNDIFIKLVSEGGKL